MKAREQKVNKNPNWWEKTEREKERKQPATTMPTKALGTMRTERMRTREKEVYTRSSMKRLRDLTYHHSLWYSLLSVFFLLFTSFHFIVCLHLRFSNAFFTALSLPRSLNSLPTFRFAGVDAQRCARIRKSRPNSMILDLIIWSEKEVFLCARHGAEIVQCTGVSFLMVSSFVDAGDDDVGVCVATAVAFLFQFQSSPFYVYCH